MASMLDEAKRAEWEALEQEVKALPKPKGKPSREHIDRAKAVKARRRAFLESLPQETQDALLGRANAAPKPKPKPAPEEVRRKAEEEHVARMAALPGYAVRDAAGQLCELVDIGINVQTRFKGWEIRHMLERAFACGTTRILLTGCDLKSTRLGLSLCEAWYAPPGAGAETSAAGADARAGEGRFPRGGFHGSHPTRVYATVGVHPHDAKTIATKEGVIPDKVAALREMASSPYCVALGECGLDYDRMFSPMEVQQHAFEAQVALAAELGRPLFVHMRDRDAGKGPPLGALDHLLAILAKFEGRVDASRVVVHCFTGGAEELRALGAKGFCVGLTGYVGMVERAAASGTLAALNDAAGSCLPLDRLLIETDSPFMRPAKSLLPPETGLRKGRNNEPSAMPAVCRAVAAAFADGAHEPDEIARLTTRNALRVFALEAADARIAASAAPASAS